MVEGLWPNTATGKSEAYVSLQNQNCPIRFCLPWGPISNAAVTLKKFLEPYVAQLKS